MTKPLQTRGNAKAIGDYKQIGVGRVCWRRGGIHDCHLVAKPNWWPDIQVTIERGERQ